MTGTPALPGCGATGTIPPGLIPTGAGAVGGNCSGCACGIVSLSPLPALSCARFRPPCWPCSGLFQMQAHHFQQVVDMFQFALRRGARLGQEQQRLADILLFGGPMRPNSACSLAIIIWAGIGSGAPGFRPPGRCRRIQGSGAESPTHCTAGHPSWSSGPTRGPAAACP